MYEGHDATLARVAAPELLAALGAPVLFVSNAAGGDSGEPSGPGDLMVIGRPCEPHRCAIRCSDPSRLETCGSRTCRAVRRWICAPRCTRQGKRAGVALVEGVYGWALGPSTRHARRGAACSSASASTPSADVHRAPEVDRRAGDGHARRRRELRHQPRLRDHERASSTTSEVLAVSKEAAGRFEICRAGVGAQTC